MHCAQKTKPLRESIGLSGSFYFPTPNSTYFRIKGRQCRTKELGNSSFVKSSFLDDKGFSFALYLSGSLSFPSDRKIARISRSGDENYTPIAGRHTAFRDIKLADPGEMPGVSR